MLDLARRAFARVDLTLAIVTLVCGLGVAGPLLSTPRAERSVDGDEELLPINETDAERALAALQRRSVRASDPPPVGPLRNVAEFEPCTGALIRYPLGISYALIKEMAEDVTVHVIVSSTYYTAALTNFLAESVDTSRVEFIVEPNNSVWTRDYGPWFVFDGLGDMVILDHYYNRSTRSDDDVIPIALGARWGIPVVTHDLWHTGGNYMSDGLGAAYSTELVWYENAPDTPEQIAQFMLDYYGIDDYHVVPDIAVSGIRHIDTWAKLLDEETVLIKQVEPSHPDFARIEANVTTISGLINKYGRPFRVVRVFCPPIPSGNVAAYTNALFLNNKVLMPTYNLPADDAAALQVYRDHMPGYEVLPFSGNWVTDDALQCRVMGIHDRYMLRVDHNPVQDAEAGVTKFLTVYADDRSQSGLDWSATGLYWRVAGSTSFTKRPLVPDNRAGWYLSQIPAQKPGTVVEYYVSARDMTGRVASRPRGAPAAFYTVTFEGVTDVRPPSAAPKLTLAVTPSPFQYRSVVRFSLSQPGGARVAVYDVRGREVARLLDRTLAAGEHEIEWMGRGANGEQAPSGVYFVVLKSAGERITRRVVLLR